MRFTQLDVFGDGGITGNPLAVVHDADGLTTAQMQSLANWTNLSETTFLLRPTTPDADYRVRIFTGSREFPFAGHPTLGTAAAWLAAGGRPASPDQIVQECGLGLVPLRSDADRLSFAAPQRVRTGPLGPEQIRLIEAAIGLPSAEWVAHEWGDNGPPWMMVQLADADTVRRITVDRHALIDGAHLGLIGLETAATDTAYEVRGLDAAMEDPVTGSLNAAAAQWLRSRHLVPATYVATQGSVIGRHGEIHVTDADGQLWIGGRTRVVISGEILL